MIPTCTVHNMEVKGMVEGRVHTSIPWTARRRGVPCSISISPFDDSDSRSFAYLCMLGAGRPDYTSVQSPDGRTIREDWCLNRW